MKKILIIHHWGSVGGSGISLFHTWKSLEKKYEVVTYIPDTPSDLHVFLLDNDLVPKTYSFSCGQISYYSGGSSLIKPSFWVSLFKAIFQIPFWRRIVREEAPDVVIVNSKVLCWMGLIFDGRKSVCMVRETNKGNSFSLINIIIKHFLEKFSLVSFLSEYDLIQANLKNATSIVSPDFLFIDKYTDDLGKERACELLELDAQKFIISFLGGYNRIKGLDLALKALILLKDENIQLVVAGAKYNEIAMHKPKGFFQKILRINKLIYCKKINKYIFKNDLQSNVVFVGVQENISTVYSASDLLIFPMKKPHQARPAFEVGVQRKAVVITDFPNNKEFVKNEINGLTFQHNNPCSLAEAIRKLKRDCGFRAFLGESNYSFTIQYHTESYSMQKLVDGIEGIIPF